MCAGDDRAPAHRTAVASAIYECGWPTLARCRRSTAGAGRVVELEPPGERLPLGVEPALAYEEVSVDLESGDVVVFASDGLPEAPAQANGAQDGNPRAGEFFSFERLAASAARWSDRGGDAEAVAEPASGRMSPPGPARTPITMT